MFVLSSIFYFVILIGVLVFVHEGGHFLFAKLFKVKVHAFSLGFGPRLFGFKRGDTDYRISAIPIGGYVKMLGEDPSEIAGPEDAGRAFTDKPKWQRFCIIAGGPAMNLVFPLFLHFGVGLTLDKVAPAEIGFVVPEMAGALAGLEPGDRVVAIDGEPVETFDELVAAVSPSPGKPLVMRIARDGAEIERTVVPSPVSVSVLGLGSEMHTVGQIGVFSSYARSVVGIEDPRSWAAAKGLRTFDKIVAVNGKKTERYLDASRALVASAGGTAVLSVRSLLEKAAFPFEDDDYAEARELRVDVPAGAADLASLGALAATDFVASVTPGSPAAKMGLRRGDKLVSLDGIHRGSLAIERGLSSAPEIAHLLEWSREGALFSAPYRLEFVPAGDKKDLGVARDTYKNGFAVHMSFVGAEIENPSLFGGAVRYALDKTREGYVMMRAMFGLLFRREVSFQSIGGPLMIGQLAGMAGQEGVSSFIWMMALISLNLGLINLLPIPILDGGQIAIIAAEAVVRRPLSRKLKERIMLVGLAMVVALMLFATRNDIMRLIVE